MRVRARVYGVDPLVRLARASYGQLVFSVFFLTRKKCNYGGFTHQKASNMDLNNDFSGANM